MEDIVEKVWGSEEIIVNNKLYCGKILNLKKDHACSYHHHEIKDETFRVLSGRVYMFVEDQHYCLEEGHTIRIEPGVKHSFTGITEARILEISTRHYETDSYRQPGKESRRLSDEEIGQIKTLCNGVRSNKSEV